MLTLYHCHNARSFRPLWTLEEMGLSYELKMLPFPPRELVPDYLGVNPLGTVPAFFDGAMRMTESAAICQYLVTRYGPTPLAVDPSEPDYGPYLNWLFFGEATLTFPQTIVLRYSKVPAARAPLGAGRGGLLALVSVAPARRRCRRLQAADALRRAVYGRRHIGGLRSDARRVRGLGSEILAGRRRLLAIAERARGLSARRRQAGRRRQQARRTRVAQATLEHDPEKWNPVFRKDHAPPKC